MTLVEIAFIYQALTKENKSLGDEIFSKLILNIKNPPYILENDESNID